MRSYLLHLNHAVQSSWVGRAFQVGDRGTTFTTELRAGTVTFLTMAYILAVNAGILSDTGGPCTVNDCLPHQGEPGCMFGEPGKGFNPGYMACVAEAKKSFISATAASATIACFLMGIMANLPLALAPGMGINAFFTYTVVGYYNSNGLITYKQAVAAVFIEGWIFLFISLTGVRGHVIRLVPKAIMLATAGGIGIFLAFVGLQSSQGIGLITYDATTLLALGGCPPDQRSPQYTISADQALAVCKCQLLNVNGTLQAVPTPGSPGLGVASATYACTGNRMRSATTWLGIFGGALMVLLMGRDFRGAILTGILFVTFVSWIPGHAATFLGPTSPIPGGQARYDYFQKVVTLPDTHKTALAWDWSAFGQADLWAALISFLYLDFLDCTGTLFSMATFLNRNMPGFINPVTREFPRQTAAFCVDAIAIIVGALLGIAPLTVYIESATGIREGGRTGLTAIVAGCWFFVSLFFTPIIASIPPYATGPALVLVGALMMENLLEIAWSDIQQALPAFLTIVIIPLTYSVASGVIAGLGCYIVLFVTFLLYDIVVSALGWSDKGLKQVLQEAVPDVFLSKAEYHGDEDMHMIRENDRRACMEDKRGAEEEQEGQGTFVQEQQLPAGGQQGPSGRRDTVEMTPL
mmetsp:Transcript_30092/g.66667  ORF Transcript_30092/g.66667 Transcript_30092/m.66667 type:complete len:637 (-) Transcript_30092:1727-3637(-)